MCFAWLILMRGLPEAVKPEPWYSPQTRLVYGEAAAISIHSQRKRRPELFGRLLQKLLFPVPGTIFFFGRLERLLQADHIFARPEAIKSFRLAP
jgi:hypothetical protein